MTRGESTSDAERSKRVRAALARAQEHARRSAAEALAAGRALLDAASLATIGREASEQSGLDLIARTLDELAEALAGSQTHAQSALFDALHDGLDSEIERWERRAQSDVEARAVLRAFLGLREILWELGIQRSPAKTTERARPAAAAPRARGQARARSRQRVQRVEVKG